MEDRNPHPSAFEIAHSERDLSQNNITTTSSNPSTLAMTAAATASFRQRFDKENVHHHHHHHQQPAASFAGNSPKAAAAIQQVPVVVKPTPLTPQTAAAAAASFRALSPVASPNLLHQNLSQLSLRASDSSMVARRRLSENGRAVNNMTPTRMLANPSPAASAAVGTSSTPSSTPRRRRVVKCRRRRTASGSPPHGGGGGRRRGASPDQHSLASSSAATSSFLPLQDPSSLSPAGDDPHNTSQYSEASSAYSLAAELSMEITPTRPSPNVQRSECCINPVAVTLWRGGEEDREWLQDQDRILMETETTTMTTPVPRYPSQRQQPPPSSSAFSSSMSASSRASSSSGRTSLSPFLPQVSNNLRDVYGANYSCEISRPIPMMARRREDYLYY